MTLCWQDIYTVLSCIGKTLSLPLAITAIIGEAGLFIRGIRKKRVALLVPAVLIFGYFLFCIVLGLLRCSSRYFLTLVPVAVLLTGYILYNFERRCRIGVWVIGIGIIGFECCKNFRTDPEIRSHIAYFEQLKKQNTGRKAAFFLLDSREVNRIEHYTGSPCCTPTMWDTVCYDKGMPLRFWQRYIFINDVVYLIFMPKAGQEFKAVDFPADGVCRISADYQHFKGRHHKKCIQIFRLESENQQVQFPASAVAQLPVQLFFEKKYALSEKNQITPEWEVFGTAEKFREKGETHYRCKYSPDHWEIAMEGQERCALRTAILDLSSPLDCYIEYSGESSKPLEIRLLVQGDDVYRDSVVAFLPMDSMGKRRSVKISFYPEMNPEKKNTSIVLNIPDGGKLDISRLAFDRPLKCGR